MIAWMVIYSMKRMYYLKYLKCSKALTQREGYHSSILPTLDNVSEQQGQYVACLTEKGKIMRSKERLTFVENVCDAVTNSKKLEYIENNIQSAKWERNSE